MTCFRGSASLVGRATPCAPRYVGAWALITSGHFAFCILPFEFLALRGVSEPTATVIIAARPGQAEIKSLEASRPAAAFSAEYRLQCNDGRYRWFSDRATLSRDNPQEQFGILLDISDRRLLEEQLAHAQKLEAIGQMTGGVAHDFNNMLSVIIGSLDRVLARPIEDAKMRSRLDLALQAAHSCGDLTKRLLGFARRQSLDPRRIDLSDELTRLREMVSRLVGKGIKAEVACAKRLWPVYVDGSQLEAAIINLVINARDAMPEGGRLRVSAKNRPRRDPLLARLGLNRGDYVELAIADTGVGMRPEVKARAFEPFFTTKEPGKGTGLGLSTIYGFVQQSGGTVTIESEVGAGTTVRLYLPKASPRADDRAGAEGRDRADELAGCRILVVDDEAQVRGLAQSMLKVMGCDVVVAGGGAGARPRRALRAVLQLRPEQDPVPEARLADPPGHPRKSLLLSGGGRPRAGRPRVCGGQLRHPRGAVRPRGRRADPAGGLRLAHRLRADQHRPRSDRAALTNNASRWGRRSSIQGCPYLPDTKGRR
jgi:signal transduction histidine kinase/CheY-like chemotaxis protein